MPINPMLLMPPQMQALYAADPRVIGANKQIAESQSTAPVSSNIEGLARALQGVAGQYQLSQSSKGYNEAATGYNNSAQRIFSQPDLAGMNTAASEEAKKSPLIAPLAQQIALLNVEKGPEITEKQMQLRMMRALLGMPEGAPAAAGAAPAPGMPMTDAARPAGAVSPPAGSSPAIDGINAPMALPGAAPSGAPAAGGDLATRIMTDPKTRLMAAMVMPKAVEALNASPEGIKATEKAKIDAKGDSSKQANIEGAKGFLEKIGDIEGLLKEIGDNTGRVQGNSLYQDAAAISNSTTQNKRDQLTAKLSDLELDVAKMKLKGQGSVSNMERQIAKSTLPRLNLNHDANIAIVADLKNQAQRILNSNGAPDTAQAAGGGNKPALDSFWRK